MPCPPEEVFVQKKLHYRREGRNRRRRRSARRDSRSRETGLRGRHWRGGLRLANFSPDWSISRERSLVRSALADLLLRPFLSHLLLSCRLNTYIQIRENLLRARNDQAETEMVPKQSMMDAASKINGRAGGLN